MELYNFAKILNYNCPSYFATTPKGVKIVFSTYQSVHIVAEGMDNSYRFNLGIFDEAHKTAGREGKKFGFALKDDNLSIEKRLFLTATPRHYNLNKRNEEGDLDLVYSMDNPDVYGEVAHELSFAVAARQDIICNYKVIISVVTSEQVSKELLKRGEVLINGDIVNAQLVAHQIAFKEAIDKYNIKRVFTFHKSINTAKSFTGKGSDGIHTQLPKFNTFHVNGTMSTVVREGVMNEFKNSDYSVISNARCLTEGVDLPAVDMVAFMSPKKSKIDIVQATGRAMRKDPHNTAKTHGYILLPLYLEITTGESIEDAVEKADFGEVWNVLQALQEQDDVLADIIRQIQEDKGKGGNGGVIIDPIDIIGIDISLKTLQEAITAVCIDKLGFTWDLRYGELIKYKEKFGDFEVSSSSPENIPLINWVSLQRTEYKNKNLNDDRIKRLEDIGFEWNRNEAKWEEMFDALIEYKENHGNCNVPINWVGNDLKLGAWVRGQRANYRNKQLSDNRVKRLKDIGFVWKRLESEWEEQFEALKEYKEEHGDCNVPGTWPKNYWLGTWVRYQRTKYRKGKFNDSYIKRLESIGFEWERLESKWEVQFEALKEYKRNHGDCDVPKFWEENKQLAAWVRTQRKNYLNKQLGDNCIDRLEDIGFEWTFSRKEFDEMRWEKRLEALKEYKKNHGDCDVPHFWGENKQLASWVRYQRANYRKGILDDDRIKRLEEISFVWNIRK